MPRSRAWRSTSTTRRSSSMRIDELRRHLTELADEETPVGDARGAIHAAQRRIVRRRVLAAGVAAIVAVAVALTAARDSNHRRGVVVAPPSTTVAPRPAAPRAAGHYTTVQFTSADEGWVCGDPVLHTADGGK